MITTYAFESIYTRVEIEDILELKKIYSTVDIIVIAVHSCEDAEYYSYLVRHSFRGWKIQILRINSCL